MLVNIFHLSDIHLVVQKNQNAAIKRAEQVRRAIDSVVTEASESIMLVTGDVAYSGESGQYEVAEILFSVIVPPEVPCLLLPGNHDCELKEAGNAREVLVSNLSSTLIDGSVTKALGSVQAGFQAFRQKMHRGLTVVAHDCELYRVEHCQVGSKTLSFLLINTALASQIREKQGKLIFPVDYLESRGIREHFASSDLAVAAFHHPYSWLGQEDARALRRYLNEFCDLVFTGHEHEPDGQRVINHRGGQEVNEIQGGVLQDSYRPANSSFNALTVDMGESRSRLSVFVYDKSRDIYIPDSRDDWFDFSGNAARFKLFRFRQSFLESQEDPGAQFVHPHKPSIRLGDVFVYPDMRESTLEDNLKRSVGQPRIVSDIRGYISKNPMLIVMGDQKSGKSALSRRVLSDLHAPPGIVPLPLESRELSHSGADFVRQRMVASFVNVYEAEDAEDFLQLPVEARACIIDDWDRVPLGNEQKGALLTTLQAFFGVIVLFAENVDILDELCQLQPGSDCLGLAQFPRLEILPFGYKKRSELIGQWLSLGDASAGFDSDERERRQVSTESQLDSLIGRNWIPSRPLYLLILLQAMHGNRPSAPATANGTHAYLYEVLITSALEQKSAGPTDIDSDYNYLSSLAYFMFERGVSGVSREQLLPWHNAYVHDYMWPMDFGAQIDGLIGAGLLVFYGGEIRFAYPYLRYYFVARELHKGLEQEPIREVVKRLASNLRDEECSNVLVFLAYKSQNSSFVIDSILASARSIYEGNRECDLKADFVFLGVDSAPSPELALETDASPESNRAEELKEKDRLALERADKTPGAMLSEFEAAMRTVQILGQVLRNFAASLPAQRKEEITGSCISLGLRALSHFIEGIKSNQNDVIERIEQGLVSLHHEAKKDRLKLKKQADTFLFFLCEQVTFGIVKGISGAVGMKELEPIFSRVFSARGRSDTNAVLDLSLRLDHLVGFPESELWSAKRLCEKHVFTYTLIRHLVWYRLHMFKEVHSLRARVCERLAITLRASRYDSRLKMVKGR